MSVQIIVGDVRDRLRDIPDNSVQCVITSPPYFGLRSYLPAGHDDKHREIGAEPTLAEYIATMVAVFREVKRVLRDDGTLWLNIGDSYCGSWGNYGGQNRGNGSQRTITNGSKAHQKSYDGLEQWRPATTNQPGLKPKDLMMVPARLAIALQDDGWYLRSDIIWAKPNPMPESVRDRPTSAHEHIFLLTKSARYYYDAEAVKTETKIEGMTGGPRTNPDRRESRGMEGPRTDKQRGHSRRHDGFNDRWDAMSKEEQQANGANLRNVWEIATQPFSGAHFATFPPEIPRRCIKAGTSEKGACSACGAPWRRVVERGERQDDRPQAIRARQLFKESGLTDAHRAAIVAVGATDVGKAQITQTGYGKNTPEMIALAAEAKAALGGYYREFLTSHAVTVGWEPTCTCDADVIPCTVLDPFGGAGTVGLVADELGRNAILIELNESYAQMSRERIYGASPLFAAVEMTYV